MSDPRPTPETDEEERIDNGDTHPLLEFARKLERERDEAIEVSNKQAEMLTCQAKRNAALQKQLEAMREATQEAARDWLKNNPPQNPIKNENG